jgi:hypothetical protein
MSSERRFGQFFSEKLILAVFSALRRGENSLKRAAILWATAVLLFAASSLPRDESSKNSVRSLQRPVTGATPSERDLIRVCHRLPGCWRAGPCGEWPEAPPLASLRADLGIDRGRAAVVADGQRLPKRLSHS